jgi:hypothetical protein
VVPEMVKLDSFTGNGKMYNLASDKSEYYDMKKISGFKAKEEYTKVDFDPNLRLRLPKMPYKVFYDYLYNQSPILEP